MALPVQPNICNVALERPRMDRRAEKCKTACWGRVCPILGHAWATRPYPY